MHIKFLAHGTGDPRRAIDYLLASKDHKGKLRPEVRVLRGDPHQVAEVVNSLSFIHRYTSGIIAWAPEDKPRPEDVRAVLDAFERLAFAGLSPDRFSYTAISHGDHVHVFIARVELLTGKSLNVAPPRWKGAFYPLRDYWNAMKGWARPQDPLRARLLFIPTPRLKPSVAQKVELHSSMGFALADIEDALAVEPEPEFLIAEWLVDRIHLGHIQTYEDVLAALNTEGTVTAIRKHSLTFLVHGSQWPLTLRGRLFAQDFNVREVIDRADIQEKLRSRRSLPDSALATASYQKMQAAIEFRTRYNQKNFQLKPVVTGLPKPLSVTAPAEMSDAADSIMGSARRALALARQAIKRCAAICKASILMAADAVAPGISGDQSKQQRALQAQRMLKKLKLESSDVGTGSSKP